MSKYTIGYDYGTNSVRGLLVDLSTGEELLVSEYTYPHGVMQSELPNGIKLGHSWALQHPTDYLEGFIFTTRQIIEKSLIDPNDIVGIGIDFTSCTILPTKADGTPLCLLPEFERNPHAYVKLWKHHAAQYCADIVNETAKQTNKNWLSQYGGKISSEWLVPKVLQIIKESPNIYNAADKIIEAGDWLVWQLCGNEMRSACNAGYKAIWHHENGYPDKEFFKLLDPMMENFVEQKLSNNIYPIGTKAGTITREMSEKTGLPENTSVAVGIIDAHAAVPACKITEDGTLLIILGTSNCHMLLSKEEKMVEGICGIVKDGIMPGYFGFEAGQSCVGDHFSWFVENCLPEKYEKRAKELGINKYEYLRSKASSLKPGESGLIALDWWNGVRSVLMDADLSGLLLGMTLRTKPEEIYRALIEATAFGTRVIIEAFESQQIKVEKIFAAGGIAAKDDLVLQIYSDICNREINLSGSAQAGALGSAIFAAAAAGQGNGGFDSVASAAEKLGKVKETIIRPNADSVKVYDKLFAEYKHLHEYFGRESGIMKRLMQIKEQA